jgi:hypothetical protein
MEDRAGGRRRDLLRVDDVSTVWMSEDVAKEGNAPAAPAPTIRDDAVAGAMLWRICMQGEYGRARWGHKIVKTGTCNGNKQTTSSRLPGMMGASWWT